MGRAADWQGVIAALQARYHVLAVDAPGHGRSTGLPTGAYTMEAASRALLATLEVHRIRRPILVGYSMGGRWALHCTLTNPGRVRALVLISTGPGLPSEAERRHRRRLDAERAHALRTHFPDFLAAWYRQPLFASRGDRPGRVEPLVQDRLDNDPEELARALEGMGTGRMPYLGARLRNLDVPVLVIAGEHDAKYVALAAQMSARMKQGRCVIVSGAGHMVHREQPDKVIAHLQNFFEEVTGREHESEGVSSSAMIDRQEGGNGG